MRQGGPSVNLSGAPFGSGSAGGGSGGSSAASGGGRGGFGGNQGVGGQLVLLAARDLVGSGVIEAKGQNGGDGSNGDPGTGTSGGGGSGGGGGVGCPGGILYLITATRLGWTGTTSVAAGAGGLGGNGGAKTGTAIVGSPGVASGTRRDGGPPSGRPGVTALLYDPAKVADPEARAATLGIGGLVAGIPPRLASLVTCRPPATRSSGKPGPVGTSWQDPSPPPR